MKQKIGICCDHYKVEMFKQELQKAGIEVFLITPGKLFTVITVMSYQPLVKPVVDKVTQHFIDLYQKKN